MFLKQCDVLSQRDAKMETPLRLAYMGDAIYEALIREYLIRKNANTVNKLHREAVKYVKASCQANVLMEILEKLEDDEREVVRRGRNAKSATIPKNAVLIDYKNATGFEALIGYLYLQGKQDRIYDLVKEAVAIIEKGENNA